MKLLKERPVNAQRLKLYKQGELATKLGLKTEKMHRRRLARRQTKNRKKHIRKQEDFRQIDPVLSCL